MLKAALVGCGRIGSHTVERLKKNLPKGWLPLNHAEAMTAVDGIELSGLCDVNQDNLARAQDDFPAAKAFTDIAELLATVKPDILSLATRTQARYEILLQAFECGVRAVHVEKPLANTLRQSKEIIALAHQRKISMTYGTTRKYMAVYQKAKDLIDAGKIGGLKQISVENGRGPLFWLHPHSVGLLLFFAGSTGVKSVSGLCDFADANVSDAICDADPIVEYANIVFTNGVVGHIGKGAGMTTRIHGDDGVITVSGDGTSLYLETRSEPGKPVFDRGQVIEFKPEVSGTEGCFIALKNALESDRVMSDELDEIYLNQQILFAIVHSSRNGAKTTKLDELDLDYQITGRSGDLFA